MRIKRISLYVTVLFLTSIFVACGNCETANLYADEEDSNECGYENPIDSIVHNTTEDIRYDEVIRFLAKHPDFVNQSDSIGYHRYSCDDYEQCVLWKDCGEIRVYSIPCPIMYATYSHNIVQYHNNGKLDTISLQDEMGQLDELFKIRNGKGYEYFILKTKAYAIRHGDVVEEYISAYSFRDGHLKKEKLFHANGRQYDLIEVVCGEECHPPLDYSSVVLISLNHFDDNDGVPAFVIAEINSNGWPTGYGLKYEWNGNWFEYVGKCQYNLDDFFQ